MKEFLFYFVRKFCRAEFSSNWNCDYNLDSRLKLAFYFKMIFYTYYYWEGGRSGRGGGGGGVTCCPLGFTVLIAPMVAHSTKQKTDRGYCAVDPFPRMDSYRDARGASRCRAQINFPACD